MASNNLKSFIIKWEGCKKNPYLDVAGVATIGCGFTTYLDGTKVTLDDPPLDEIQIDRILNQKLDEFSKQVKLILGDTLVATLPTEAIDALISISYNIGTTAFAKSTLLKRVKADKNDLGGIEDAFLMWVKAGGKVVNGLQRRRAAEFAMYRDAILAQYTKWECYQLGYRARKEGK